MTRRFILILTTLLGLAACGSTGPKKSVPAGPAAALAKEAETLTPDIPLERPAAKTLLKPVVAVTSWVHESDTEGAADPELSAVAILSLDASHYDWHIAQDIALKPTSLEALKYCRVADCAVTAIGSQVEQLLVLSEDPSPVGVSEMTGRLFETADRRIVQEASWVVAEPEDRWQALREVLGRTLGDHLKPEGTLAEAAVHRVVEKKKTDLQRCYGVAMRAHQAREVQLHLGFEVLETGAVGRIIIFHNSLPDDLSENCATMAMGAWRFPAPSGGPVVVDLRLEIQGANPGRSKITPDGF
ncbi:MAG: AgmX/PglI C-terminal domain-containing protein [Myxococcota bacterium]